MYIQTCIYMYILYEYIHTQTEHVCIRRARATANTFFGRGLRLLKELQRHTLLPSVYGGRRGPRGPSKPFVCSFLLFSSANVAAVHVALVLQEPSGQRGSEVWESWHSEGSLIFRTSPLVKRWIHIDRVAVAYEGTCMLLFFGYCISRI